MVILAGYIRSEAERLPTKAMNLKVNKNILNDFRVKCKERGLVLNNVIEVFVRQYGNRRYYLNRENILKWKDDNVETETLNCMVDKEAYNKFKELVKGDGLFVRHVVSAFIEDYVGNDLILEFVKQNKEVK